MNRNEFITNTAISMSRGVVWPKTIEESEMKAAGVARFAVDLAQQLWVAIPDLWDEDKTDVTSKDTA